jgi:hypothetical protein
VPEEKRLRNYGADAARSEQADQGSKEMDEKNHQVAHRSMVARRGILRNYGRNNNSPETGIDATVFLQTSLLECISENTLDKHPFIRMFAL